MVLLSFTTLFLFLQSLFGLSPSMPLAALNAWATTTGVVSHVVDGDTIDVKLADGTITRVRYIGMNTPEIHPTVECGGASAAARNRKLVENNMVTLVPGPGPYDPYGRRLAYVYQGTIFVNEVLVREGWASLMMIPPNTAYRSPFEILQETARSKRAGIWSCPKGH